MLGNLCEICTETRAAGGRREDMTDQYVAADLAPFAVVLLIGAAEAAHLCGLFLHLPFHSCVNLFIAAAACAFLVFVLAAVGIYRHAQKGWMARRTPDLPEWLMFVCFTALVLSQLYFIFENPTVYRQGDMTAETVESFLKTDAIYQVNPLTGREYGAGMPSRLKILCLPTLYGALCRVSGIRTTLLVWRLVPVFTLLGAYGAYTALGRCLFPADRKGRLVFLNAVALLIWGGCYLYGMDGFGLLYSGWRGVTIRNAVLLPWLVALCLRKKRLAALLCVAAEACIVWTTYGMGVCFLTAVGISLAGAVGLRIGKKRAARGEA